MAWTQTVVAGALLLWGQHVLSWNSGPEDSPGPLQARKTLMPTNVTAFEPIEDANEHGFLFLRAFNAISAYGLEIPIGDQGPYIDIDRWLSGREFVVADTSNTFITRESFLPQPPLKTRAVQRQRINISGLAGLPDHSFGLWDFATGNESCPPAITGTTATNYASAVKCHSLDKHLGAFNSTHFGTQAADTYRAYHQQALTAADECVALREAWWSGEEQSLRLLEGSREYTNKYLAECQAYALALEAVGQHFLQDVLAVGHMWPRWGSPELSDFPEPKLEVAKAVAVIAGSLHGSEALTGLQDPMSGGIGNAFTLPGLDGAQPGVGDGRVDELFFGRRILEGVECDPKCSGGNLSERESPNRYLKQAQRLDECMQSGIAEVWRALGGSDNGKLYPFQSTDERCLGAQNTASALATGVGVLGSTGATELTESAVWYQLPKGFTDDNTVRKELITDLGKYIRRWQFIVEGSSAEPEWPADLDLFDVKDGSQYSAPASYSDVGSGRFEQGFAISPDTDEEGIAQPINPLKSLSRLFNRAHVKENCGGYGEWSTGGPLERPALRNRIIDPQNAEQQRQAAIDVCTEAAARTMELYYGRTPIVPGVSTQDRSPSICQLVGGGDLKIDWWDPNDDVESAARDWCAPGYTLLILQRPSNDAPIVQRLEEGDAFTVPEGTSVVFGLEKNGVRVSPQANDQLWSYFGTFDVVPKSWPAGERYPPDDLFFPDDGLIRLTLCIDPSCFILNWLFLLDITVSNAAYRALVGGTYPSPEAASFDDPEAPIGRGSVTLHPCLPSEDTCPATYSNGSTTTWSCARSGGGPAMFDEVECARFDEDGNQIGTVKYPYQHIGKCSAGPDQYYLTPGGGIDINPFQRLSSQCR